MTGYVLPGTVEKYSLDGELKIIISTILRQFSLQDIQQGYIRVGYAGTSLKNVVFDSPEDIEDVSYVLSLEEKIKARIEKELVVFDYMGDDYEIHRNFIFTNELYFGIDKLFDDLDSPEKYSREAFLPIVYRICDDLGYNIFYKSYNISNDFYEKLFYKK